MVNMKCENVVHNWVLGLPQQSELIPHSIYFVLSSEGVQLYTTDANSNAHLVTKDTEINLSSPNNTVIINNGTEIDVNPNILANIISLHNEFPDLQGGVSGEYYHLTQEEHLDLLNILDTDFVLSVNGTLVDNTDPSNPIINLPTYEDFIGILGFTPENIANKTTNFNVLNNTLYPSIQAVKNELDRKENLLFNIVVQPGITYTLQASDNTSRIIFTNNNQVTLVVPNDSIIPVGSKIEYTQEGDGNVVVSPAAGVVVLSSVPLNTIKGETRRLTKIGVNKWTLEGNVKIDPLVGGVIFVSNTFGDDTTATIENRNKPFKTLNAAIAAYWANTNIDYIEIIDSSSYTTTSALNNGTTRKFDIRSQKSCVITINTVGVYAFGTQEIRIDIPFGTVVFSPTTSGTTGFGNATLTLNALTATFNSTFTASGGGNSSPVNITTTTLNINSLPGGIISPSGGTRAMNIKSKTINFRGANSNLTGAFVYLNLDFELITHDNTFTINSANPAQTIVSHGSINGVSPYVNTTNFNYINGGNTTLLFKNGAIISSNVSISMFNNVGKLILSGIVNYQNSDRIISGFNQINGTTLGVEITNAVITCKQLFGFRCLQTIQITNSTITLTGNYLGTADQTGSGQTYVTPTLKFVGINFILGISDGFNIYQHDTSWTHTNKPSVDTTKGVLYTNGKFNRDTIIVIESPLNQYYDTTQRQLVIVNEKQEIANKALDSSKTYMIDGTITLNTGDYIEIPNSGLTVAGYGFGVSKIIKNVTGEAIFKSAVGGSGDVIFKDLEINSGNGQAFDLTDSTGNHAIEINDVNFQNCSFIGKLRNYRQFTGTTIGIYGCNDGFLISGTWTGFKIANTSAFSFGVTGTLFKKDSDTIFSNRMYLDLNLSLPTGAKICDFSPSNFTSDKLLQIRNSMVKVNGNIDPSNTSVLFPNISAFDSKSFFGDNIGLQNSFDTPYGIDTINLSTYINDSAAAAAGLSVGKIYIESTTGYLKKRLI